MSKGQTLNPSTLLALPGGPPRGFQKSWNKPRTVQNISRQQKQGHNSPKQTQNSPKHVQSAKLGLQRAPGQDLAQNGFSKLSQKVISIGSCKAPNCQTLWLPKAPGQPSNPKHLQSATKWLQRAPAQDLAQNGCFPMVPEGHSIGSCKEPNCQTPRLHKAPGQDWLHKAPGQDLAADGCFALIPTSNFNR